MLRLTFFHFSLLIWYATLQKLMISLSSENAYMHFAMFTQLRSVTSRWCPALRPIAEQDYPQTLCIPQTVDREVSKQFCFVLHPKALFTFLRQMPCNLHLMHYATDLLPFLEMLPE